MSLSSAEKQRLKTRYGSWALVTGASSGIGREIAERLAEAGLNLLLVARRQSLLEELAATWRNRYAVEIRCLAADLGAAEGVAQAIAATEGVDVGLLVAAAGFGTSGLFVESNLEEELDMLRVNGEAVLRLCHHFGRRFVDRGRGGIILLGSIVGFQGVPYAAHYSATKAYVQSLAEALAVELRPSGVDVLAAAPGPVESGFGDRARMQMNMALTPSQIGIPILKALGRRSSVWPGGLSKLLIGSLSTAPRWAKVRIMAGIMKGMVKGF